MRQKVSEGETEEAFGVGSESVEFKELQVRIFNLNWLGDQFESSQLRSFLDAVTLLRREELTGGVEDVEASPGRKVGLEVLEASLGEKSLMDDRIGLAKIKFARLPSIFYVISCVAADFCGGDKVLWNEEQAGDVYPSLVENITGILEKQQESSAEDLSNNGSIKLCASVLALAFLFENQILNAFDKWRAEQLLDRPVYNWSYLLPGQAHKNYFLPSQRSKALCQAPEHTGIKTPVFVAMPGVYIGNLAFTMESNNEELDHSQEASSDSREEKASPKRALGKRNLRLQKEQFNMPTYEYAQSNEIDPYRYHYDMYHKNFIRGTSWNYSQKYYNEWLPHNQNRRTNENSRPYRSQFIYQKRNTVEGETHQSSTVQTNPTPHFTNTTEQAVDYKDSYHGKTRYKKAYKGSNHGKENLSGYTNPILRRKGHGESAPDSEHEQNFKLIRSTLLSHHVKKVNYVEGHN